MNPLLSRLQPYPFEKLRALYQGVEPNPALKPINLSIGEPKHPAPKLVEDALVGSLKSLAAYPATAGQPLGPWVKDPRNPILASRLDIGVSSPGHNSITHSPDGKEMFIVYHSHADPGQPTVQTACLLLLRDGAFLQLEQALHHAPRLRQLIALGHVAIGASPETLHTVALWETDDPPSFLGAGTIASSAESGRASSVVTAIGSSPRKPPAR
mgnify:CR=1 FL=1